MKGKHGSNESNDCENDSEELEELYKKAYSFLYEYRFGRITFLEALGKIEEVLNIDTAKLERMHQQTLEE